jgi:hypothetical protein
MWRKRFERQRSSASGTMREEAREKDKWRKEGYVEFCCLQYYAVQVPGAAGERPLARL